MHMHIHIHIHIRYIYTLYIYMHATTNEERGHSLEREQGEVYRRVWREEKEEVCDIIILAQKIRE